MIRQQRKGQRPVKHDRRLNIRRLIEKGVWWRTCCDEGSRWKIVLHLSLDDHDGVDDDGVDNDDLGDNDDKADNNDDDDVDNDADDDEKVGVLERSLITSTAGPCHPGQVWLHSILNLTRQCWSTMTSLSSHFLYFLACSNTSVRRIRTVPGRQNRFFEALRVLPAWNRKMSTWDRLEKCNF